MPQIDRARIAAQAQTVFQGAGETAILRRYVSASAGNARFGMGNPYLYYTNFNVTGLFYERQLPLEASQAGGITTQGAMYVALPFEISQQDEVIWRGTAYRVDGPIQPEVIGGRMQYRAPLVVDGRTGA